MDRRLGQLRERATLGAAGANGGERSAHPSLEATLVASTEGAGPRELAHGTYGTVFRWFSRPSRVVTR